MRKIILLIFVLCSGRLLSQDSTQSTQTTNTVYNLSIGASAPAFSILDLSPSSVERPKDPNNFAILLQTATENFTSIPRNFALEVAPFILYDSIKSYGEFASTKLSNVLRQSFVISVATTTTENEDTKLENTRLGFGFKISFLRGEISNPVKNISSKLISMQKEFAVLRSNSVITKINEATAEIDSIYQNKINKLIRDIEITDSLIKIFVVSDQNQNEYKNLVSERVELESNLKTLTAESDGEKDSAEDKLQKEKKLPYTKEEQDKLDEIAKEVSKIEFIRDGFKLDLSYAMAYNFPGQNLSTGKLSKLSTWLVFGGDFAVTKKGSSSIFGAAKFVHTPNLTDTINTNENPESSFNAGIRMMNTYSDFSLSGEYLYDF